MLRVNELEGSDSFLLRTEGTVPKTEESFEDVLLLLLESLNLQVNPEEGGPKAEGDTQDQVDLLLSVPPPLQMDTRPVATEDASLPNGPEGMEIVLDGPSYEDKTQRKEASLQDQKAEVKKPEGVEVLDEPRLEGSGQVSGREALAQDQKTEDIETVVLKEEKKGETQRRETSPQDQKTGIKKPEGGEVVVFKDVGRGEKVVLSEPRFEGEVRKTETKKPQDIGTIALKEENNEEAQRKEASSQDQKAEVKKPEGVEVLDEPRLEGSGQVSGREALAQDQKTEDIETVVLKEEKKGETQRRETSPQVKKPEGGEVAVSRDVGRGEERAIDKPNYEGELQTQRKEILSQTKPVETVPTYPSTEDTVFLREGKPASSQDQKAEVKKPEGVEVLDEPRLEGSGQVSRREALAQDQRTETRKPEDIDVAVLKDENSGGKVRFEGFRYEGETQGKEASPQDQKTEVKKPEGGEVAVSRDVGRGEERAIDKPNYEGELQTQRKEVLSQNYRQEVRQISLRIDDALLRFRFQNEFLSVDIRAKEMIEKNLSYLDVQRLSRSLQSLGLSLEGFRVNGTELYAKTSRYGKREERRFNIEEDAGSIKEALSGPPDSSGLNLLL